MQEKGLMRHGAFAAIWLANAVSVLGDWLHAMALTVLVYELTGSGLAVGLMLVSKVLPALFMGAVAGVIVDRWSRKWLMVASDVARFLMVLCFLLVRTPAAVVLVVILNLLLSAASSVFRPARSAALAGLVPRGQLVTANAWLEGTSNIVMLVGTLTGGVLTGAIGPYNVFLINAGSFLISAAALLFVPGRLAGAPPGVSGQKKTGLWRDFVEGLQRLAQERVPFFLILFYSLWILGVGMANVVMIVFARDVWGAGAASVSYLYSAVGAGAIVGALCARPVSERLRPVPLLIGGIAFVGLVDIWFGLARTLATGCALLFLAGIWDGLMTVANDSTIMKQVPQRFVGRVFSVYGALTTACNVFGMLLSGLVSDLFGARMVMVSAGVYMVLLAAGSLVTGPCLLAASTPVGSLTRRSP
ncbi:MAG: MFS transporter [Acetobacteraceae bacterium]|nr:MFS transporter [Acetobacteraceae bacterium]